MGQAIKIQMRIASYINQDPAGLRGGINLQSSLACKPPSNCDYASALTKCYQLVVMEGPAWSAVNAALHGLFKGPTSGLPDFNNPYDENTLNKGCEVGYRNCMIRCF